MAVRRGAVAITHPTTRMAVRRPRRDQINRKDAPPRLGHLPPPRAAAIRREPAAKRGVERTVTSQTRRPGLAPFPAGGRRAVTAGRTVCWGHGLAIREPLSRQVPHHGAHLAYDVQRLHAKPSGELVNVPARMLGLSMAERPVVPAPHRGSKLFHPVDVDLPPWRTRRRRGLPSHGSPRRSTSCSRR